ncbi:glycosyl hydrolase family 2 [Streptomyces sulfonofaciens]|uniref:Glycosyl hydrolase family 2 n=1 Tax=Streptomyces sulfonofaciens TaxID=68272 RepID=A0A919GIK8_9ACTN|nr:glycosyl hydrolase [Streptomyces sulfonofaciens]GHH84588.1 glycosyl hydrolase family 2 [Streptomyces sulfonofaciens]
MIRRRDVLRGSAVLTAAALAPGALGAAAATAGTAAETAGLGWGPFTHEMRPWTRWWWLGSAVTEEGLARHLRQFADVGFGGVEIQPIYEAQGYEDRILWYLSAPWLDALDATTRHARDLGLGVDLTTGSGWTMGGPWITPEISAGRALIEQWELSGGERLGVPVRTVQPPHPGLVDEERLSRPDLRPPMQPLPEPPLAALVAREASSGRTVDLTGRVGPDRTLDWTAPEGRWQLTGVFSGLVLKRVERAGPGGKGLLADYFDAGSIRHHLDHFGTAVGGDRGVRALFHDSFELERTDWTPAALTEFARLRGYDLVPHLPEVFTGAGEPEVRARVLSDVRETFSDLFLKRFAEPWADWSAERGWLVRNQAHGSPANLLDIYGAADIPETEYLGAEDIPIPGLRKGTGAVEPPKSLVWRFASSPAHHQGGRLVGAETATWRDEHYHVSLSQVKPLVDVLFSAGVNHVVFHGTAYSPDDAPWPGFSFYAATELKPANTLWHDLPELTGYITRCQSVLQGGSHGNDVLVYWPQHDLWALPDAGLGDAAEDIELTPDYKWQGDPWMYGHPTGAGEVAAGLEARGWQFDWVSDRQLAGFHGGPSGVVNEHGGYAVVVVPGARLVPLDTAQRLHDLAAAGATVVFVGDLPADVPGLADLDGRRARLAALRDAMRAHPVGGRPGVHRVGAGRVVVAAHDADLDRALAAASAVREPAADSGLRVLRRRHARGWHYFLANVTAERVDGWYALGTAAASVGALDPLRDVRGPAETRRGAGGVQVRLRLDPGQSLILRTFDRGRLDGPVYRAVVPDGDGHPLSGTWTLTFREGGPALPPTRRLTELVSWPELGDEAAAFSGTARYTLAFTAPRATGAGRAWALDLGDVRESARVRLNGQDLGTAWALPFRLPVGGALRDGENVLQVEVTNLAANRVRDLARRGELHTDFYMSWRGTTPPPQWEPVASGLLGPVRLVEVAD